MSCTLLTSLTGKAPKPGPLLLAIWALAAGLCFAGDPIQFSGEKGKQGPQQEKKVDNDLFKSWNKEGAPSPLTGFTPYIPSTRTDPKDLKRLKKEREEKRNWLLLNPGDLTGDDDEGFGGNEYSLDKIDKDSNTSGDYTFYPLLHGKSGRGAGKNANQRQPDATAANSASDQKLDFNGGKKDTEIIGAHTSRELDLKNLLDTKQTGPGTKSELTLFDFLKDNSAPKPSRDQVERRSQFENFLNSTPSDPLQPRTMMDPINFGPDFTRQPLLPNTGPSVFDSPASAPRPDFSPKQDFNPNRSILAAPDFNSGPRQPWPSSPNASPLMPEPNNRPTVSGSPVFNNNNLRRPGI
jgi:hypothetical protein